MEFKLRFFGSVLNFTRGADAAAAPFGVLYVVFTKFVWLSADVQ